MRGRVQIASAHALPDLEPRGYRDIQLRPRSPEDAGARLSGCQRWRSFRRARIRSISFDLGARGEPALDDALR